MHIGIFHSSESSYPFFLTQSPRCLNFSLPSLVKIKSRLGQRVCFRIRAQEEKKKRQGEQEERKEKARERKEGSPEVLPAREVLEERIQREKTYLRREYLDQGPVWITIGGQTLGHLMEVLLKFGYSAVGILLYLLLYYANILYDC